MRIADRLVRASGLEAVPAVGFDLSVRAFAATQSGDRFFLVTVWSEEIEVVVR